MYYLCLFFFFFKLSQDPSSSDPPPTSPTPHQPSEVLPKWGRQHEGWIVSMKIPWFDSRNMLCVFVLFLFSLVVNYGSNHCGQQSLDSIPIWCRLATRIYHGMVPLCVCQYLVWGKASNQYQKNSKLYIFIINRIIYSYLTVEMSEFQIYVICS